VLRHVQLAHVSFPLLTDCCVLAADVSTGFCGRTAPESNCAPDAGSMSGGGSDVVGGLTRCGNSPGSGHQSFLQLSVVTSAALTAVRASDQCGPYVRRTMNPINLLKSEPQLPSDDVLLQLVAELVDCSGAGPWWQPLLGVIDRVRHRHAWRHRPSLQCRFVKRTHPARLCNRTRLCT
jgi:hypothetical protein